MNNIKEIQRTVQKNCDLIDAEHGQNYGLCIYLLKMRDYYRWHNKIPLYQDLNNDDIHKWIAEIEDYWEKITGDPLEDLPIGTNHYKPFESEKINQNLVPEGLIYSGGLGYGGIPLFFLAELEEKQNRFGFEIFIANRELSRGLFGTPAFYREGKIFVRKEALKHLTWSRYDEWSFSKRDNTLGKALGYFPFAENPQKAIEDATDQEMISVIQHEIGEGLIDQEFGSTWQEMILEFAYSKTEILLRAVRDLAVDCMSTLPFLLDEERIPSIHMYFAGFSDMRKALFPSLYDAYKRWQQTSEISELSALVDRGKVYWFDIGKKSIEMFNNNGRNAQNQLNHFIENLSK